MLKRRSISDWVYPSFRSVLRVCRDFLASISLFFTCTENLLSHWKVNPKIYTSLQLGILPIGADLEHIVLPSLVKCQLLYLFLGLQDILFASVQSQNCVESSSYLHSASWFPKVMDVKVIEKDVQKVRTTNPTLSSPLVNRFPVALKVVEKNPLFSIL